jgi:hypothetical protein
LHPRDSRACAVAKYGLYVTLTRKASISAGWLLDIETFAGQDFWHMKIALSPLFSEWSNR